MLIYWSYIILNILFDTGVYKNQLSELYGIEISAKSEAEEIFQATNYRRNEFILYKDFLYHILSNLSIPKKESLSRARIMLLSNVRLKMDLSCLLKGPTERFTGIHLEISRGVFPWTYMSMEMEMILSKSHNFRDGVHCT